MNPETLPTHDALAGPDGAEVCPAYTSALVGFAGLSGLALLLGISPWSQWPFVISVALTLCAVMLAHGRSSVGVAFVGAAIGSVWVLTEMWRSGPPALVGWIVPIAGYTVLLWVLHKVTLLRLGVDSIFRSGDCAVQRDPLRDEPLRLDSTTETGRAFVRAFECWHRDWANQSDPWRAFDGFLREALLERIGAKRVRCFHVVADRDPFVSLTEGSALTPGSIAVGNDGRSVPSAPNRRDEHGGATDSGIEGHVAATGKAYIQGQTEAGPTTHALARRSPTPVAWCFAIKRLNRTIGVVRVGHLPRSARNDHALLALLAGLVSVTWCRVHDVHELGIAHRTDPSSGVLARSDFLTVAARAIADSTAAHEPIGLMVLALEGMRRLDDGPDWAVGEQVVQRVCAAIDGKLRSDDILGRFSEDRFVVLLRRVDTNLGRLIAENVRRSVVQTLVDSGGGRDEPAGSAALEARCAVVGTSWPSPAGGEMADPSGQARAVLHDLIGTAFSRLDAARQRGQVMAPIDDGEIVPERVEATRMPSSAVTEPAPAAASAKGGGHA